MLTAQNPHAYHSFLRMNMSFGPEEPQSLTYGSSGPVIDGDRVCGAVFVYCGPRSAAHHPHAPDSS